MMLNISFTVVKNQNCSSLGSILSRSRDITSCPDKDFSVILHKEILEKKKMLQFRIYSQHFTPHMVLCRGKLTRNSREIFMLNCEYLLLSKL